LLLGLSLDHPMPPQRHPPISSITSFVPDADPA